MIKNLILSIPIETLEKAYQYILSSQPLPDNLLLGNSHTLRHSIIIFYKKYDGDKTNFRLGFDLKHDLAELRITRKEFEDNFDQYCELTCMGKIVVVEGADVCLISLEVLNSLYGYK